MAGRRPCTALDVAPPLAVDQISRTSFGPRDAELKSRNQAPRFSAGGKLRDADGLARGDGGNDERLARGDRMKKPPATPWARRNDRQGAALIVPSLRS